MDNELGTGPVSRSKDDPFPPRYSPPAPPTPFAPSPLPEESYGHFQDEELDLFRSYLSTFSLSLSPLTLDSEITKEGLSSS